MYLVALTHWGAPFEAEIAPLAAELGLAPYDARLKLGGAPPIVVADAIEEERARSLLGFLRRRGHGAIACNAQSLPSLEAAFVPVGFGFEPDAFVGIGRNGERRAFAHSDLLAIVRAAWFHEEEKTTTTVQKKFALGRAIMTSGLVRSRRIETVRQATTSEREDVAYVFRGADHDPMILCAPELVYDGLGAERGPTLRENFLLLLARLRREAPRALYDERLLKQRRWPGAEDVRRSAGERVVARSNAEACTLAAYLLVHAHLQGQA